MNTLKANQSLARNALSVEFSKLARKWLSIVASKRFEDQETILATDCSHALRKLKRHGFLAEISNLLAEEPRIDPPGVFSFDPPGRDFFRFAGYCELELVELSEEYADWVLRPGLFNDLVQTLGMITPWDFEDPQRLTLDNPEVMDAVFDMYHQICETLSKAILDEGTKAASTDHNSETVSGLDALWSPLPGQPFGQAEPPSVGGRDPKDINDHPDEKECIQLWLGGKKYREIDKLFVKAKKERNGKPWTANGRGDAFLTIRRAKANRFLVPDDSSITGYQWNPEFQNEKVSGNVSGHAANS